MKIKGLTITDTYDLALEGNYVLFMEFLDRNIDQPWIPILQKRKKNRAPASVRNFFGIIEGNMFEVVYKGVNYRHYGFSRITGRVTHQNDELTIEVIQKINLSKFSFFVPIIVFFFINLLDINSTMYINISVCAALFLILFAATWMYCYVDMQISRSAFIKEMKTLARLSLKEYDN